MFTEFLFESSFQAVCNQIFYHIVCYHHTHCAVLHAAALYFFILTCPHFHKCQWACHKRFRMICLKMKLYVSTLTLFGIRVLLINLVNIYESAKCCRKKETCVLYCVQFCCLHYIFWANEVKESKHGIIIVLCIHFVTSKYVKSLCLFHVSP